MSTVDIALLYLLQPVLFYLLLVVSMLSQMGSGLPSNSALGVKVGLRDAVFYGFPYKRRLKPKTRQLRS